MPECSGKAVAHHLCAKHYRRWVNNGDPDVVLYERKGKALEWLMTVAATCTSDTCLEWPFNKMGVGYGKVWVGGRYTGAHREICLIRRGPPPFDGAEAAHSCGNRGCVNPGHISWKTRSANADDRKVHGTADAHAGIRHKPRRLLSDAEVGAIRTATEAGVVIAAAFGVDPSMVSKIKHGHRRSAS